MFGGARRSFRWLVHRIQHQHVPCSSCPVRRWASINTWVHVLETDQPPWAPRPGGNVGMLLHSMQYNNPHSSYNQDRLAANNPEYAALREESKLAAKSGDQAQVTALKTKLHEVEATTFEKQREAQRQRVINLGKDIYYFAGGAGNALGSNLSLGAMPRNYLSQPAFVSGQRLGDGLSIGLGAAEYIAGEGMTGGGEVMVVASSGALVPMAVPLSEGGVAMKIHGTVVMGKETVSYWVSVLKT